MKRLLLFLPFLFGACAGDKDVDPAKSNTFVRYFNGGNNDAAQSIQQTSDNGFIILANSVIRPSEVAIPYSKIKLIKTDEFGNVLWQKLYPDFANDSQAGVQLSRSGGSMLILPDGGYVIVGTDIQSIGSPKLYILTTDAEGNNPRENTISTAINVTGRAIALNTNGNYLVLGSVNNLTANMFLAEIRKDNLAPEWVQAYGDGETTLANKLFLDSKSNANWGATVKFNNSNKVRLVQTPLNSTFTTNAAPIGTPGTDQQANDICRFGFGYAVIGNTNEKFNLNNVVTGDDDIFYQILTENGNVSSTKSFPIEGKTSNEVGNSICASQDGGLVLLGTIQSEGDLGRGEQDYYIIKINAFGDVQWTKTYGSKFIDIGVSIIQARDGSYVALGTTQLGGIRTVMMMKINKEGNLE